MRSGSPPSGRLIDENDEGHEHVGGSHPEVAQRPLQGRRGRIPAAAREYVEKERRLNHHVLADDLERILVEANGIPSSRKDFLTPLVSGNGNLPRDKERNALLIELVEPKRELGDLVLSPGVRRLLDRIVLERRRSDLLGSFGMRPAGKVLFCGPPGCGKSVASEALARELYLPLATVRFDAVVSSYLGETAANLRKVFEFARSRPMVLLFDEFDAIGKERTALDEHGELKRVVSSFLQLLDGFHAETLTVAATNHQGLLDPALSPVRRDCPLPPAVERRNPGASCQALPATTPRTLGQA